MVLPESFTYQATPEYGKRTLWRYFQRRGLVGVVAFNLFSWACLHQFFTMGSCTEWGPWLLLVSGLIGPTFAGQWIQAFQTTDALWRGLKDPTVTIRVSEDTILFDTFRRKSELAWDVIPQIWKYPDMWIVFLVRDGYYTSFPTAACPPELLAVIESKVREAGGNVS